MLTVGFLCVCVCMCVYFFVCRNVTVNYTVSLGSAPDVTSSAINCHSSFVLQEAYSRDKILQDELQELEEKRSLYSMYTDLIAFWEHVLDMRKFKLYEDQMSNPESVLDL